MACASSHRLTMVGFRRPRSMSLIYCWEKPDRSASSSCVRPRSTLIRFKFRPTSNRMSMRTAWRPRSARFINYYMYFNTAKLMGVGSRKLEASGMKTFKANVKLNGRYVEVQVQARNQLDAKAMIEAQYGKGSMMGNIPSEVR